MKIIIDKGDILRNHYFSLFWRINRLGDILRKQNDEISEEEMETWVKDSEAAQQVLQDFINAVDDNIQVLSV